MKRLSLSLAILAALTLCGCADLGFGIDVDDDSPYYYGTTYYPGYAGWGWNGIPPVWDLGPVARPVPRPPMINGGVGPELPPRPSGPVNTYPGINRVPTSVNGIARPGNGGLANPGAQTPRRANER